MNHDNTTTERRIAPAFGPTVMPPHRPRPLTGRTREEDNDWDAERALNNRHNGETDLIAGEQFAGESDYRIAREATGYRTSPFIARTEESS